MSVLLPQDQFDARILDLVNQERVSRGLVPLTLSEKLDTAADLHSRQMALQDFFGHDNPVTSSTIGSRARDHDYTIASSRWGVGENIAAGQLIPEAVMTGWMNSPGHRANILNSDFRHLGFGYYELGNDTGQVNYQRYWTQSFGFGGEPGEYVAELESPVQNPDIKDSSLIEGTSAGDVLVGRSSNDVIQGLRGNDTLRGRGGADRLEGGRGSDVLIGGAGHDRLMGGEQHDRLQGGGGNDRLIGVNLRASSHTVGRGERDTLIGNQGRDTFVLGQSEKVFYDDHNDSRAGAGDYGLIVGFNQSSGDRILLEGDASDYVLGQSGPRNLPSGTKIYLTNDLGPNELIGVVRNVTITSLTGGAFRFV